VLFESFESNIAYYNAIFAQVGQAPLNPDEEIKSISYAAADVFKLRARENAEMLARIHGIARTIDQRPFFDLLRPPFELRPFMLELKRRYRLALATNRSATVPALVQHLKLADVFDAIASALDKVAPKPAPDILRLCLERAKVRPENAIYIGDSPIDREAAEAAGVAFIGVGTRVEHNHRIATLRELEAALLKLPSQ
ncbi:MAG TPA: HAD-IA family hydrolase, partial [Candidatus Binataceae bacterium]|nr:HAD-IA family hydrolase [Candidatus Binataceae bacterium]